MSDQTPETRSATGIALLRCLTCQVVTECSLADQLRFTRDGWPKCCGETMTLYTRTDKPNGESPLAEETKFS